MRKYTQWMVIIGIIFSFCSPVYAGWKEKITKNQIKATEYIMKLKNGADPDVITRPKLRRDRKARAQAPNREIRAAMDQAERYARAGKHEQIEAPEFKHKLVSKKRYKTLEKDANRRK